MIVNLTQKERTLLEDQKSHEEICIKKYNNYANLASDPELKSLFHTHASNEQSHLDSINQLLNGQLPNVNSQSGGGQGGSTQSQSGGGQGGSMQSQSSGSGSAASQQTQGISPEQIMNSQVTDKDLCTDILMTEKYVSGTYDTAIFEFKDPEVRNVLNHIQKEEQQHGESVFKYMESKGLYQVQ